jgi:hypothetical protein
MTKRRVKAIRREIANRIREERCTNEKEARSRVRTANKRRLAFKTKMKEPR